MVRKRRFFRCVGLLVLIAVCWCAMFPALAEAGTEEVISVESGSTTEMELDQTYQISSPAQTTTRYIFEFTPAEDGGYYLEYEDRVGSYALGLEYYVIDEEDNLLAGSSGSGYYMLKAGKTYVFEMNAIPNYRDMPATGRLTMTKEYSWDECVRVENGIATGCSANFRILHLPDGVEGMERNPAVYGIQTLVLPESIQDPVDYMDFWTASYRYETTGTSGRYLAEEGVLYDQKDQILRYVPSLREGTYTVKDGTKEIGSGAFDGTNLEEVIFPDSVESMSSFGYSQTLKNIQLSANIQDVRASYFQGLYELEALEIPEESEQYETRDGVLFRKSSDTDRTLEFYPIGKADLSYTIPDDVTTLARGSFARAKESGTETEAVRNLKFLTIPDTVIFLDGFLRADSYSSDVELTLRGYEGSAAHQYWLDNYSAGSLVKWETLGETGGDEKREFELKIDNNSFRHISAPNTESGFWGTKGIALTNEDYQKLFAHEMDDGMRDHLRNCISGDVEWKGSCYGIASVIGRVFNQDITISDVSDSGKSCIYDLAWPREDAQYLSTISYYQLLQYIYDPAKYELSSLSSISTDGTVGSAAQFVKAEEASTFFRTMMSALDEDQVLLLRMPGHAVLVLGYEKKADGYSFQIYDENSVGEEYPEGQIYEWKVSKDFQEFECEELLLYKKTPFNEKTFGWLSILRTADIEPKNIKETQDNAADILIDVMDRFVIRNSEGKLILSSDGETKIETGVEVKEFQNITSSLGDITQASLDCKFTVADEETYEISNLGESAEVSLYNGGGYLSLSGTRLLSAKMTPGEYIEIQGEKGGSFTAVIDTDEKVAENETGLISIAGTVKGEGTIKIQTSGENVTITSEDGIENLQLKSFVGNEVLLLELEKNDLTADELLTVKATGLEKDEPDSPEKGEINTGEQGTDDPETERLNTEEHVPETGDIPVGGYLILLVVSVMAIYKVVSFRKTGDKKYL